VKVTINIPDETISFLSGSEGMDEKIVKETFRKYFKQYEKNNSILNLWLEEISGQVKVEPTLLVENDQAINLDDSVRVPRKKKWYDRTTSR